MRYRFRTSIASSLTRRAPSVVSPKTFRSPKGGRTFYLQSTNPKLRHQSPSFVTHITVMDVNGPLYGVVCQVSPLASIAREERRSQHTASSRAGFANEFYRRTPV